MNWLKKQLFSFFVLFSLYIWNDRHSWISIKSNTQNKPHARTHENCESFRTLKHTLQNEDSEIALFVKDLKRGRRLDFEPTIQHYENLLREKNVTKYRITVIPVNQLYNEYATFELRRKLSYLYDKFLVDSSIAAHVNGFLGSKMLKKGRLAFPVDLSKENLSAEIDKALRKVFYKHVNQGITQNVQVGRHSMPNDQIAENIIDLLRQFGNVHPGGYKNVHKLYLRPQANVSVVIPLYVSAGKYLCYYTLHKKINMTLFEYLVWFGTARECNWRAGLFSIDRRWCWWRSQPDQVRFCSTKQTHFMV